MDSRTILVSWRPPKYPNGRIRKYKVYLKSLDGIGLDKDYFDVPPEQTQYAISHLALQRRYEFWVSASTAVGEGPGSRSVLQAPASRVPARAASFSQPVTAILREELWLPCHCVGQPAPLRHWRKNGAPMPEDGHIQITDDWHLHISPVRTKDAGNYTCSVENIFGKDEITYYVTVQENRSKGIPSAPTDIQITSTTISSIVIQWNSSLGANSIVQGYYLHFKREFGEWEKLTLVTEDSQYVLNNLQCGTRYYFYLQAFNQLGQSSPTSTIIARTKGSAPVAPNHTDLVKVNSTSISLNLTSWDDGGCPITSVVVEYKLKKETTWILVSNNVKVEKSEFLVLDLTPGTWYTLRVTAHNSAGSTVANYDFITLTYTGATVAPDAAENSVRGSKIFYKELGIILPTITAIIILIAAVSGLFIYLRKNEEMFSSNKFKDKPLETGLMSDAEKKTMAANYDSDDGLVAVNMRPQDPVYLPTPMRVSLGHRQDISPYATFRVPLQGSVKTVGVKEDTESRISPGPAHYSEKIQPSEVHETCTESTYSKMHEKIQHNTEAADWIPLHNLYQAHRY